MTYSSIHFYIRKSFLRFNLQQNHHRENYNLIELAAKLKELMLNQKDSADNNLKRKHSELAN